MLGGASRREIEADHRITELGSFLGTRPKLGTPRRLGAVTVPAANGHWLCGGRRLAARGPLQSSSC